MPQIYAARRLDSEGCNWQVRRMTAAVGFPTLRLIRSAIGPYTLCDLAPGAWLDKPAPSKPPGQKYA